MELISIVVPVHNGEGTIDETLDSVESATDFFSRERPRGTAEVEVVAVDDGSEDYTLGRLMGRSSRRLTYHILHRDAKSSPAHARNCGVAAARGGTILFLDADDTFLEGHILACHEALLDPSVQLVKTGVRLTDQVHPDWIEKIANSLVINLAVRKECHERIGGFFDYHLVRRFADGYEASGVDVFYMIEDVFYNEVLKASFRLARVDRETCVYRRRPGNSFDSQYEKFLGPASEAKTSSDLQRQFRVQLAQTIATFHKLSIAGREGPATASGRSVT